MPRGPVTPILSSFRVAARTLTKRPAFTAVAVASIALGVGFNTAIFSAANALLLRPVPGVRDPDRVVEVGRTRRGEGFDTFGYPEFVAFRDHARTLDAVGAWTTRPLSFGGRDGGERVSGMAVSPGYFRALKARAERGRLFGDDEGARAAAAVAVVSHAFWRDRLGGDPAAIGSTIEINRQRVTVVGVTEPGFSGHLPMLRTDVWLPITRSDLANPNFDNGIFDRRGSSWLMVLARLASGATVSRADAEVGSIMAGLAEAFPESNGDRGGHVIALGPIPGAGRPMIRAFLGVLLALVSLILLTAAANVAGMLLASTAAREKEIAVRLALGAGRRRIVAQLLAESLLLFAAGGVAGFALAWWGTSLLTRLPLPSPQPILLDLRPDGGVLAYALAVALATGLLFGLLPALQSTRPDLVAALRDGGGAGLRRSALRRGFAAAQVGVCLVLLAAAGLFLRSLQHAGRVDAHFRPDGVEVASLDLALDGYNEETGPVFQRALLRQLRSTPGVDGAALAIDLPMDLSANGSPVWPEGWQDPDGRGLGADFNVVSPGYFETLRIPVLRGRAFSDADREGAPPAVVVNAALARAVWGDDDPVGRRLRFGGPEAELRTVVGVVPDVKNQTLGETVSPIAYLPLAQYYRSEVYVLLHGRRTDAAALRRAVLAADPKLSLGQVQPLEAVSGVGLLPQRLAATLATALGALALFLAILGVYGVVSFSVARRRRELGIRSAVGASAAELVRLVVSSGLRAAAPGLAVGLLAALAVGRLARGFLFGISPLDPVTYLAVAAVLMLAVLVASWIPARRAARLDPVESLRSE